MKAQFLSRQPAGRDATPANVGGLARVPPAYGIAFVDEIASRSRGKVVQAKSAVGPASDPLEQDADRMAEAVVGRAAKPAPRISPVPADAPVNAMGAGSPLEPSLRALMEPHFGHDFRDVRVHADPEAARSADSLGARAYTMGRDVVFGDSEYAPNTLGGQELLAHELTHVVQQSVAGGPALQLKAKAIRFQDEPTLDEISEGKKELKPGDKGEAVIRVTTALSELGHYQIKIIDESFDPPLTSAVVSYQKASGLEGKVPAGTVEKKTFDALDADFSAGFAVERTVLSKQKSADILNQTQSLDPAERTASARAISTEPPVNPITGLPPTFKEDIPLKGKYGARLQPIVEAEILDEWNTMAKGKTAEHAKAGALYDAPTVDAIAVEAQKAVDAVFGEYTKGRVIPALKLGVSVKDAWKKKEDDLTAGGKAEEDASVSWRVQKILNGDRAVKALDREHGAIQSRAKENGIVKPIKNDLMVKHRDKLLELHKAWPGFEDANIVYVQLFKGSTPDQQRSERWDFFQTFIHEYIHSLESGAHIAYRGGIDEQKGGFTLREGTTDYFTKIVWNSVVLSDALRARIEGPVNDPKKKFAVQPLNAYDEAENAERLAGVVGIRNVAAAFFLGKVDLIGKP